VSQFMKRYTSAFTKELDQLNVGGDAGETKKWQRVTGGSRQLKRRRERGEHLGERSGLDHFTEGIGLPHPKTGKRDIRKKP